MAKVSLLVNGNLVSFFDGVLEGDNTLVKLTLIAALNGDDVLFCEGLPAVVACLDNPDDELAVVAAMLCYVEVGSVIEFVDVSPFLEELLVDCFK